MPLDHGVYNQLCMPCRKEESRKNVKSTQYGTLCKGYRVVCSNSVVQSHPSRIDAKQPYQLVDGQPPQLARVTFSERSIRKSLLLLLKCVDPLVHTARDGKAMDFDWLGLTDSMSARESLTFRSVGPAGRMGSRQYGTGIEAPRSWVSPEIENDHPAEKRERGCGQQCPSAAS